MQQGKARTHVMVVLANFVNCSSGRVLLKLNMKLGSMLKQNS